MSFLFLALQFHSGCIKTWLRQSVCCPLDWHVIYNPLTWSGNDIKAISATPPTSSAWIKLTDQQDTELFVSGIGLQRKEKSDISKAAPLAPASLESIVQDTQALCIDSTHTAPPNSCESGSMQSCLSLKQVPILACRKRMSAKTSCPSLSECPVVGGMEGSGGTQQSLFVGFSKHDDKTQRKASSLRGQIRPMRLEGDGVGSGDQRNLDLQPTSIPISAKCERN